MQSARRASQGAPERVYLAGRIQGQRISTRGARSLAGRAADKSGQEGVSLADGAMSAGRHVAAASAKERRKAQTPVRGPSGSVRHCSNCARSVFALRPVARLSAMHRSARTREFEYIFCGVLIRNEDGRLHHLQRAGQRLHLVGSASGHHAHRHFLDDIERH
jgi:hypothetical protein